MTPVLTWDGKQPIQSGSPPSPAGRGELQINISHTLLDDPESSLAQTAYGTVASTGDGTKLARGTRVALHCKAIASLVTVPETTCFETNLPPQQALQLPMIADILRGLDRGVPDFGWNAIITGSNLRADLVTQLVQHAGARSVTAYRPDGGDTSLASALATMRGPVVAIDTTGRAAIIQSLLSALPAHSVCILLSNAPGGVASVNFYLDVHRKNIRIVGGAALTNGDLEVRADRLLRGSRLATSDLPTVVARTDAIPTTPSQPFLLEWPGLPG